MLELSPSNLDEAAAAMLDAAREKRRVGFVGGGTELGLGRAAEVDLTLRTGKMARILDYAPADMVLAAEAGVTLAKLQEAARANGQMLALDPPLADRVTVGGLVATAAFGPLRARYGGIRDLIIGVTLVRGDGQIARGGGKVVKNVAGFDLPKVACGSMGTLALIAGATFRLHPLPEASAAASLAGLSPATVVELVAAMVKAQLEPVAVVAVRGADGRYAVGVRFEGFGKGVDQQVGRFAALAPDSQPGGDFGDAARTTGTLRAKLTALPTRLESVDALVAPLLGALAGGSFAWYATLGIGFVSGDVTDAPAAASALEAARAGVVAAGGSLVITAAPASIGVDPWGPLPGAFRLMKELKKRFDPDGRLNPGRFVGGI